MILCQFVQLLFNVFPILKYFKFIYIFYDFEYKDIYFVINHIFNCINIFEVMIYAIIMIHILYDYLAAVKIRYIVRLLNYIDLNTSLVISQISVNFYYLFFFTKDIYIKQRYCIF